MWMAKSRGACNKITSHSDIRPNTRDSVGYMRLPLKPRVKWSTDSRWYSMNSDWMSCGSDCSKSSHLYKVFSRQINSALLRMLHGQYMVCKHQWSHLNCSRFTSCIRADETVSKTLTATRHGATRNHFVVLFCELGVFWYTSLHHLDGEQSIVSIWDSFTVCRVPATLAHLQ